MFLNTKLLHIKISPDRLFTSHFECLGIVAFNCRESPLASYRLTSSDKTWFASTLVCFHMGKVSLLTPVIGLSFYHTSFLAFHIQNPLSFITMPLDTSYFRSDQSITTQTSTGAISSSAILCFFLPLFPVWSKGAQ